MSGAFVCLAKLITRLRFESELDGKSESDSSLHWMGINCPWPIVSLVIRRVGFSVFPACERLGPCYCHTSKDVPPNVVDLVL
jgi:hypothetical protein